MTIYKQETIPYDDGTERVIYSFPPLKDCDDLKKIMVLLESICGKIDEMIITNCTSDDDFIKGMMICRTFSITSICRIFRNIIHMYLTAAIRKPNSKHTVKFILLRIYLIFTSIVMDPISPTVKVPL